MQRNLVDVMRSPRALLLLLLALALLSAACGDGSSSTSNAPPAGGVFEADFGSGDAALNLTHTALLRLEASGTHDGDSHGEEGVDEISYFFEQPTRLTLDVGDELDEPLRLILRNSLGVELAHVDALEEQISVRLRPGRYTLELHHPHAGDGAAPEMLIFVQAIADRAAASIAGVGTTADDSSTVRAGKDCIACNVRGIFWVFGQVGAANLSLSDFTGAMIEGVEFNQTTLVGTIFDKATIQLSLFDNAIATRASFKGAKFISGARFQDLGSLPPGRLDQADFSGASFASTCLESTNLSGTTFAGATFDNRTVVGGSNFTGADLSTAVFNGTNVKRDNDDCGFVPPSFAVFRGATLGNASTAVQFLGVDLTGIDLGGADLRKAVLRGSRIDGKTNFAGTNFSGASFDGVDLSQADLSAAVLDTETSFVGATLSDGVEHGVNLSNQRFAAQSTQFSGADLAYASFNNATLAEVDLGGADLQNAELIGADLNFANLRGANLVGARLGVAPGSGQAATRLRGAFMVDVDLTDADLRSADLTGVHLYGDTTTTLLVRTQLDSADFDGALCTGTVFSGSLTNTVFNNANLVNAVFNGANLTNAKFDTSYLQGADFSAATSVAGVQLSNSAVSTESGTWMFTEQDGTPFTFGYGATQLGALATDTSVTCPDGGRGPCGPNRLTPVMNGPFPPQPPCVPKPPRYDNCLTPTPTPEPG